MPEVPKGCNGLMATTCTGIVFKTISVIGTFHLSKHPPENKIQITIHVLLHCIMKTCPVYHSKYMCTCKTREQQSTNKTDLSDNLNLMLSLCKMLTDVHVQYKSHKLLLYKTTKQDGMYIVKCTLQEYVNRIHVHTVKPAHNMMLAPQAL